MSIESLSKAFQKRHCRATLLLCTTRMRAQLLGGVSGVVAFKKNTTYGSVQSPQSIAERCSIRARRFRDTLLLCTIRMRS